MRTYFRIEYKRDEYLDCKAYQECAYIIVRDIMGKLDKETPEEANYSFGEICVVTKNPMEISEMKNIIKILWANTMSHATGSINGFRYHDLKPSSFTVSIEEVTEKHRCNITNVVVNSSDNIIEFFSMQDMNRIFNTYDNRKMEIEKHIKTVADCL